MKQRGTDAAVTFGYPPPLFRECGLYSPHSDSNLKYQVMDARWNLVDDDIEQQSEATINFLCEILR
jgi:hypothetical protein